MHRWEQQRQVDLFAVKGEASQQQNVFGKEGAGKLSLVSVLQFD